MEKFKGLLVVLAAMVMAVAIIGCGSGASGEGAGKKADDKMGDAADPGL